MTNLVSELGLAIRRLIREPGFTVTAVATVAIGIGIAASVFALVEGVLVRPLPYPDSGRLVSVRHVAPGIELMTTRDRVSPGIFLHYRDGNRVFEGISTYSEMSYTLTDGRVTERIQSAVVSPELFAVLQVVPQIGRLPTAADHDFDHSTGTGTIGALIGHDLWVRRYDADPEVIGRTIEVDGRAFPLVVGVAPEGFAFPDTQTELWVAIPPEQTPWSRTAEFRQGLIMGAVARLHAGVTLESAEADLNRLVHLLPEAFPDVTAEEISGAGLRAVVRPYKEEIVGDVRLTLLLVLASGGFLLLVTWANVANLLLLRTHGRRVEIGILRALGATERDVARRLLSESLLLTITGGLLGLGLASLAAGARFGFPTHLIPRLDEVEVNAVVVMLVVILAVASGTFMAAICLGSIRQWVAGPGLSQFGGRSTTEGPEGQTGRRILVAAQLALALTLLVGSGLMARTFWQLQQVDLGFRPEGRLSFYLPVTHIGLRADYHEFARLHDQVLDRLRAVPGVDAVEAATTSVFPLTLPEGGHRATIAVAGAGTIAQEGWPVAHYGFATPGYFQAMSIPLVAGRPFRGQDTSAETPGTIISQSLARALFADADPIGRSVEFVGWGWASLTVVAVAGDVPGTTPREGGSRAIYLPHLYPPAAEAITRTLYQYVPRYETYVVRTNRDVASLVPELRRAVDEVDPRLPMLDIALLDEIVTQATAQERITMRLLLVSAGGALFLAVVGLYGVLAYSVRRRTREIGIRIALGATPQRVARLVVSQGAVLSAAGIAAGLAGALLLTRFISSLLYGTSPTDAATFTTVTLLLFGVALAASYIPARRASCIDPALALRAE